MKIRKTVFTFVVLSEVGGSRPRDMDLADLEYETDQGDMIGKLTVVKETTLPNKKAVVAELKELGNDGEFFNDKP